VTDAYVRVGQFSGERVLGGSLTLDAGRADAALAALGKRLGLDSVETAAGILDVTTANMYAQFMSLMARKGIDPRDFAILAYGGAGPTHAFLLAKEVGIARVVVPPSPGTLCALGSLVTDLRRDFIRTVPPGGHHLDKTAIEASYAALEAQAQDWLEHQDTATTQRRLVRSADMRYRGQSFDLSVAAAEDGNDLEALVARFHEQYRAIYGFADPAGSVEITNLRVMALGVTPKPRREAPRRDAAAREAKPRAKRSIYEGGRMVEAGFYDRLRLAPGDRFAGPGVVEAPDTTVYVPAGFTAQVDAWGNLIGEAA
jgi:N-methylhydantoinase A